MTEETAEEIKPEIIIANYYADNFRGFKNQTFSLRPVNFLVGENSSGKSSLIYLISLFSSQQFWMQSDFEVEDFNISRFDDVCSHQSEDNTFRIGKISNGMTVFIEFKKKRGYPRPTAVLFSAGSNTSFGVEEANNNWIFIDKSSASTSIDDFMKMKNDVNHGNSVKITLPSTDNLFAVIMLMLGRTIKTQSPNENDEYQKLFVSFWDGMSNSTSIAPIRARPKRIYEGDNKKRTTEGDHIPYVLKRLYSQTKPKNANLEKFGQESGLFNGISLKTYGDDEDSPFSLNIILGKGEFSLLHVGYGVSQVLPIILDMERSAKGKLMLIQQPEVHLHPRAQAQLGEYFYSNRNDSTLVIETHSDFLIDRFRQKIRDSGYICSQVIFFIRQDGFNNVFNLKINEAGQYPEEQPKAFREFFYDETLNNLGI